MDNAKLRKYFEGLGLEAELAGLYLALHKHGPQTMSELARSSGIERTRIYRLSDQIKSSGLFMTETKYKRSVFEAAPIGNVEILLARREQELKGLRMDLATIEQHFQQTELSARATRVNFYQGAEGAKQMLWNETRAQTRVDAILYQNMQVNTKRAFFEHWVQTCNERDIHFRGIVGESFNASQVLWSKRYQTEKLVHWQPRYIEPELLPITNNVIIYDDVVAYYQWNGDEIFGIEVHNQAIADTQRRLFEMAWQLGDASKAA
jgi:hypothetical protein